MLEIMNSLRISQQQEIANIEKNKPKELKSVLEKHFNNMVNKCTAYSLIE